MAETTPAWLAERLKKEGEKIVAYFSALTAGQWQSEVYTEGDTWTIRNVLAHFVTSERGLIQLFKDICNGGVGVSEDFSIDYYNARQQEKTRDLTPQELLAQFAEVRAATAKWVSGLSQDDLAKEGRHPFLGQVQLVEMLKMIYLHNQIHFRDFRKLVE
ncbi:MAG: DinB family protein [Anaerolineales bacterium]